MNQKYIGFKEADDTPENMHSFQKDCKEFSSEVSVLAGVYWKWLYISIYIYKHIYLYHDTCSDAAFNLK